MNFKGDLRVMKHHLIQKNIKNIFALFMHNQDKMYIHNKKKLK